MKIRKLRKIKQEQQGWPNTLKCSSTYGYSMWAPCEYKFVHPADTITCWPRCAWRGLA